MNRKKTVTALLLILLIISISFAAYGRQDIGSDMAEEEIISSSIAYTSIDNSNQAQGMYIDKNNEEMANETFEGESRDESAGPGINISVAGLSDYQRAGVYNWRDIVDVFQATEALIGLKADGTLVAIGRNHEKQLDFSGWNDIISVDTGYKYIVGLKGDGTVVAAGLNDKGQCNVSNWTNICAIYVSDDFTLGLTKDGKVLSTGNNGHGQCNTSTWTDVAEVYVNGNVVAALKTDGTVAATGRNDHGQCDVSSWRNIVQLSVGGDHIVGLKNDGKVVVAGLDDEKQQVGFNYEGPVYSTSRKDVGDWKDIVDIGAGSTFTVGLDKNGDVFITGAGSKYELEEIDKRYNLYGTPWSNITDIEIYKDEGVIGISREGKVYAVVDNSVVNKMNVPEFKTGYAFENGVSKLRSMEYDLSKLSNVKDIRVEEELVVAVTPVVDEHICADLILITDPEIVESDKAFLTRMGDFYSPELISEADKFYYRRYFGYFGRSYDIYKEKKVSRVSNTTPSDDVKQLAMEITKGIDSNYKKVRAISKWVSDNMYYDYDFYYGDAPKFSTKLGEDEKLVGVCENYAYLTQDLINSIHIPCSFETGSASGLLGWDSHAWNEAFVDGRWMLIDTTWNSNNQYYSLKDEFIKAPSDMKYFDMPVEEFSKTHHAD